MRLRSKPHEIEAFKFNGTCTIYPDWFKDAYTKGKAFITNNNKVQQIEVISRRGNQKAFKDDWVCLNKSNVLFVLSDEEILTHFEGVDIDLKNV
jgi:monomeric isocitrate dehydrogenase